MITISTRRRTAALAVPLMLGTALTGCADKHLDYLTDYSNHRPLRVTGHPSTDSLEAVQKVVWRLADGDVEGLAAYGKAARGEVSADFEEDFAVRQSVVLHFTGPSRTEEITARPGPHDTWGIVLVNPEPKDVKKSGPAPTTR
ncbi:hypothetical protein ACIPD2_31080 [Streptomyces griseofuscus]|uniref:hypothetical protein n=1 Tax=Streptomyces griseofuscus TaxID=146922 RepID=UPI0037FE2F22